MVYIALAMIRRKDDWAKDYVPVGNESGSSFDSGGSALRILFYLIAIGVATAITYYVEFENDVRYWGEVQDEIDRRAK